MANAYGKTKHSKGLQYVHPPINASICMFVDYLPWRYSVYNDSTTDLTGAPLTYYVFPDDIDLVNTKGSYLFYLEDRNIEFFHLTTKASKAGYLKVNKYVYSYLRKSGTECTPHVYRYYLNGGLIDESNFSTLLRLKKWKVKTVDISEDEETGTITIRINENLK